MSNSKCEQWINIKSLVKLPKSATETFRLCIGAYGKYCVYDTRVFEWHEQFFKGRESVKDDRPGRLRTSIAANKIKNVWDVIQKTIG